MKIQRFYSFSHPAIKIFITVICFYSNNLLFHTNLYSQQVIETNTNRKGWTTTNPFKTEVFIQNFGQFDKWVESSNPVKYLINSSEKIFFTQHGLVYKLDIIEKNDEEKEELRQETPDRKEEGEKHSRLKSYYVTMEWEGCNNEAVVETSMISEGYYTCGEKGYENLKAKGYKKLTYKNLYPGIDVEYTFPENKAGIKYQIILHPGANSAMIKMKYSGDVNEITKDISGNILIKTPAGDIIDHAPESFYKENKERVQSAFEFDNNTVSFKLNALQTPNSIHKTLIIDPWTTVPTTLSSDNAAYDIASDDFGNIYVSGGTTSSPYHVAKYSSTGSILWTYTVPLNWSSSCFCYSKFSILPHSGTVFMGEGFNTAGPRMMKINSAGNLLITSPNYPPNNEIWVMFYNRCLGQLNAFGGGTTSDNNIYIISDTNLTNNVSSNFNTCFDTDNDIASVVMDYNGDFFCLMSSGFCVNNNHLQKSLISTSYTPPTAFDVSTGYDFYECYNNGIPGFANGCGIGSTVRANTLALNNNFLYSYDGNKLIAWDKNNGNQLGSIIVNLSYPGGQYRTHEGIAVDNCNNVYVGGTNKIHAFSFNGTTFTTLTPITTNITNEVYDVSIDKSGGLLNVCGLGFVSILPVTACPVGELSINIVPDSCINAATVVVNNGTPPYAYYWSNGQTSNTISGVAPGTYFVTVMDNSCILKNGFDSIVFNSPNVMSVSNDTTICLGSSVVLSAQGANSYNWSPAGSLSSSTSSIVTATPNDSTTYTVIGTFSGGCTSSLTVTVNIVNGPNVNLSNDTSICIGDNIMLHVSGGTGYIWQPAATLDDPTISNPTANPSTTTTYTVTIFSPTCNVQRTVTVSIITINSSISPPVQICNGESVDLIATGGAQYSWHPTYGLINPLSNSTSAHPDSTTTYVVTISDGGCHKNDSVTITVTDCTLIIPNVFTPNADLINDFFEIIYKGFKSYHLIIFNRWGKKMFESNDKNIQWNGNISNTKAADGVYYYVLTIGQKSYNGTVSLLR